MAERYLVLQRRPFRDRGEILEGFSVSRGRVSALARRGKQSGLYDPPVLLEVRLQEGRGSLSRVSQSVLVNPFSGLKKELSRLMVAGFLSRLFLRVVPEESPDEELFGLLLGLLESLAAGVSPVACGLWGQERLLSCLGLAPELESCLACGSPEVAGFSARDGGVLCGSCYRGSGFALRSQDLSLCRQLRFCDLEEAAALLPSDVTVLSRLYKEHFLEHVGVSEKLFRRVLPRGETFEGGS